MRPWFQWGSWPGDCSWKRIPYICVTKKGIHFNNDAGGHNAHWHDLRHPLQRDWVGDYRWVFFFKQVGRGLRLVFTGKWEHL